MESGSGCGVGSGRDEAWRGPPLLGIMGGAMGLAGKGITVECIGRIGSELNAEPVLVIGRVM